MARLRALRLVFTSSLVVTAACGSLLSFGDDDEEAPGAATPPSTVDSGDSVRGADGSAKGSDEDSAATTTRDRSVKDAGVGDADAARQVSPDADAGTAQKPDADAAPPCPACATGHCTRAPGDCDPLVFITAAPHVGDFHGTDTTSGPSGPDFKCQQEAANAGIAGTFRAWIGAKTTQAGETPKDRIKPFDDVPYRRRDGTVVVASYIDFQEGQLQLDAPINLPLNGAPVVDSTEVWTGLMFNGRASDQDCLQWTSGDVSANQLGAFGIVKACPPKGPPGCNGLWSSADAGKCSVGRRLYCIQSNE